MNTRILKRTIAVLLASAACFTCACTQGDVNTGNGVTVQSQENNPTVTATIEKNGNFESCLLSINIAEFEAAGFSFGDSCDIEFSNGDTFTDVPFYDGYYGKTGTLVIVGHVGDTRLVIGECNDDFWTQQGLNDGESVTITQNSAGKYADIQNDLKLSYTKDRNDYDSDEQFANFRALTGGNLKENYLFRGASPINNAKGRAAYANKLIEQEGIETIIDLADIESEYQEYVSAEGFESTYAKRLHDNGKTVLLGLNTSYGSDYFKSKIAEGMRFLTENSGKTYIHCLEGKDRTGFVCLLLEGLAGATYDELLNDYMITYSNYYDVDEQKDSERYEMIKNIYFNSFVEYLCDTTDLTKLKNADYSEVARKYLMDCGLSEDEVSQLKTAICK